MKTSCFRCIYELWTFKMYSYLWSARKYLFKKIFKSRTRRAAIQTTWSKYTVCCRISGWRRDLLSSKWFKQLCFSTAPGCFSSFPSTSLNSTLWMFFDLWPFPNTVCCVTFRRNKKIILYITLPVQINGIISLAIMQFVLLLVRCTLAGQMHSL